MLLIILQRLQVNLLPINLIPGNSFIIIGAGSTHSITHIRDAIITTYNGQLVLRDVFLVQSFKYCLLSISQFTYDNNSELFIFTSLCFLKGTCHKVIPLSDSKKGTLYLIQILLDWESYPKISPLCCCQR